jgi:hypothetical protein
MPGIAAGAEGGLLPQSHLSNKLLHSVHLHPSDPAIHAHCIARADFVAIARFHEPRQFVLVRENHLRASTNCPAPAAPPARHSARPMPMTCRGGRLCRAVRRVIAAEPMIAGQRQCPDCQHETGGGHGLLAERRLHRPPGESNAGRRDDQVDQAIDQAERMLGVSSLQKRTTSSPRPSSISPCGPAPRAPLDARAAAACHDG